MHGLLLVGVCIVTWIAWQAIALLRSYNEARGIGLPVIISPTGTLNPFWIVSYKATPIIPLLQRLPFNLGRWARFTYIGWQYDDKGAIHQKLGPAFVLCTPGLNEVHLADPPAVHTVLTRRKEFMKPAMMYEPLNVFGRNLDAVEGETWQRHRKLTAPNFNERVSGSVWSEAQRQAQQMLGQWTAAGLDGTQDVVDDTAALALHVLTYAGFGVRHEYQVAPGQEIDAPHRLSYRDALLTVLRNFTLLVMLPMRVMEYKIMPRSVRRVGEACRELKLYMRELVERERATAAHRPASEATNLLSALVRASESASQQRPTEKADTGTAGLADDELYGNLFIYSMAGHETTANTIATAIAYLAALPHWQDWLREEIAKAAAQGESLQEASPAYTYESMFPKLVRCQAVMLETLRLHGSTVFLPKTTGSTACSLAIAGTQHVIPRNTLVVTNSQALHSDRDTWGADALEFRPTRWLKGSTGPGRAEEEEQELFEPPPGTFVGWADGPRICPGKKFSQVEFVSVMAVLFREHKVLPKQVNGASQEMTAKRLEHMIQDSGITAITLQMKHPQSVALVWSSESGGTT